MKVVTMHTRMPVALAGRRGSSDSGGGVSRVEGREGFRRWVWDPHCVDHVDSRECGHAPDNQREGHIHEVLAVAQREDSGDKTAVQCHVVCNTPAC